MANGKWGVEGGEGKPSAIVPGEPQAGNGIHWRMASGEWRMGRGVGVSWIEEGVELAVPATSWPGLSRPSPSCPRSKRLKTSMPGSRPGMTAEAVHFPQPTPPFATPYSAFATGSLPRRPDQVRGSGRGRQRCSVPTTPFAIRHSPLDPRIQPPFAAGMRVVRFPTSHNPRPTPWRI